MNRRLVKKAQKGDDEAFLRLFQQYEHDLYRTAFVYMKNKDDALDIVQEVAYKSFKKIETLRTPAYFKTWLIRMTINTALNTLKKEKRVVTLDPEHESFIEGEEPDIPETFSLHQLIDELEENEKSVVILKYYYGYTFPEIAEILHIPLGTAKSILYRALKTLRKEGFDE